MVRINIDVKIIENIPSTTLREYEIKGPDKWQYNLASV